VTAWHTLVTGAAGCTKGLPIVTRVSIPAEVAGAVALNVRRLRAARQWSLDALATRSGVSKGMLVQLEGARTNPSLGILCRVAEAFSVSLTALIETDEAPPVQVVPPGGGTILWTGAEGGTGRLLVGADEREHVELWRWEMAPGEAQRSDDGHAIGTLEMVHVISGELTVEVEGEDYAVGAGAAAAFRSDRGHAYRNDGAEPCSFVMVILQNDADLDAWASLRMHSGSPGSPPPGG
jgi:transcriptional regulator with XRE-family HTH domain